MPEDDDTREACVCALLTNQMHAGREGIGENILLVLGFSLGYFWAPVGVPNQD